MNNVFPKFRHHSLGTEEEVEGGAEEREEEEVKE